MVIVLIGSLGVYAVERWMRTPDTPVTGNAFVADGDTLTISGTRIRLIDIDEHCMQVLARRQPVASDLRFLTTALKLVTDLERIGDLGVNICERVLELNGEPPLKPYVDMPNMAREVQEMLHEGLDAFVASDVERAQQVIARDRNVDAYYTQIFRELLTYMMEDPRNIFRATRLQSIAKYLERIGDHATNVGELVVFMVKGKDIRHAGKLGDAG